MKLSISNIAWTKDEDKQIYEMMKYYGFSGLEIAPTRIFPEAPYEKEDSARTWAEELKKKFGFLVSSIQSIWYGRQERIFGTEEEFEALVSYTKQAINFAVVIGCKNLVLGCPRNRSIPDGGDLKIGIRFFKEIGDYAADKGTVIGMEANPSTYNTNYINDTASAFELIEAVSSEGFKLNLDIGTMIQNGEKVDELISKVHLINHVHVSEPGLKILEERPIHYEIKRILSDEGYKNFVSIEMGRVKDVKLIEEKMNYVRKVFA